MTFPSLIHLYTAWLAYDIEFLEWEDIEHDIR